MSTVLRTLSLVALFAVVPACGLVSDLTKAGGSDSSSSTSHDGCGHHGDGGGNHHGDGDHNCGGGGGGGGGGGSSGGGAKTVLHAGQRILLPGASGSPRLGISLSGTSR